MKITLLLLLAACAAVAHGRLKVHRVLDSPSCSDSGDRLDCGERLDGGSEKASGRRAC
jgi:hypothetical protein